MARKKETTSGCFPDCCEACPLAEAVKIIARLVEDKTECEDLLRIFVTALREADRRLANVELSGGGARVQ
jgi:hypothetical protein